MSRNHRPLWVISSLALVGLLLAIYDFASRTLGIPLFCPFAGNGCDIVQNSPYAVIFGIPDLTGDFCTSGSEREFTQEGRWYADEEVQAGADRHLAAAD